MLTLRGEAFVIGRCSFHDSPSIQEQKAWIRVPIRLGSLPETFAILDTASEWSMVNQEYAEELGAFSLDGEEVKISTRKGTIVGRLVRVPLTIPADEGEDYSAEATVFVSKEWTSSTFVGYRGLLEFMRFALDPRRNDFYFGPV